MPDTQFGKITLKINTIIQKNKISKNKLCKELEIDRKQLNRYCSNKVQRIDTILLCKLCFFFDVPLTDIIEPKSRIKETRNDSGGI